MRYGFWLPVFGGWLRNVEDEGMAATWDYSRRLCRSAERIGYDLTLVAELNLNDIKGAAAPALDAWSTAAALTAVTDRLEYMVAVRPTFHNPALLAKQAATIDHIGGGRLSLNVVSSWWKDEAEKVRRRVRGARRPVRPDGRLAVLDALWTRDGGDPRRPVLPGAGLGTAAQAGDQAAADAVRRRRVGRGQRPDRPGRATPTSCTATRPTRIAGRVQDMAARRDRLGLPPMRYGMAAYAVVRGTDAEVARITDVNQSAAGYGNYQQWLAGTRLEQRVSLEDYSVSNRGLRAGLVGTPAGVTDRVAAFAAAGVDRLLLQCSPQLEELERFAHRVIGPHRGGGSGV